MSDGIGSWAVTPEAVILELPTATLGTRIPARLLDLLIEVVVMGAVLLVEAIANVGGAVTLVTSLVLVFAALFVYPVALETLGGGRTLGKMIVGLRVVSTEGAPISFRQAVIRAVLWPVDIVAGPVSMLVSSGDQRLGDLAAGTVVVRYRTSAVATGPAWFPVPPGLEGFAYTLDVTALSGADYEMVRSYLLRWRDLAPEPRWYLGVELARAVAGRLHHSPPPWLGPDHYLACVAAARSRRAGPPGYPPPG